MTTTKTVLMKRIRWNSTNYKTALQLRNELLNQSAQLPTLTKAPLEEKQALHFGAFVDGAMAGTFYLKQLDDNRCQIKQVAVSGNCQGLGLGKKMITHGEHIASLMGLTTVVIEGRQSAWGFYEKLGYQSVSSSYSNASGAILLKLFEKELQIQDDTITLLPNFACAV